MTERLEEFLKTVDLDKIREQVKTDPRVVDTTRFLFEVAFASEGWTDEEIETVIDLITKTE